MIIDTSAIVAIINDEPQANKLERALSTVTTPKVGAPTCVEASMVLTVRLGIRGRTLFARFLQRRNIEVLDFTEEHVEVAAEAFHRFGKGRHPAKLNMGDCFTYAVAQVAREPLLCIGNDFAHTDLELVPV